MSIPPLVCSTPPPPDQCEDDKDPEYFDLSYNLSQEDEDDESNSYSYGNFSHYNNFESTLDKNSLEVREQETTKDFTSELPNDINLKYENIDELEDSVTSKNAIGIQDIIQDKLKCEDDVNIEDLNLKIDEELDSIVEQSGDTKQNVDILIVKSDIPSNSNTDSPTCDAAPISEIVVESTCDTSKESEYFVTSQPEISMNVDIEVNYEDNNTNSVLQDNILSTINESPQSVKLKENFNSIHNEYIEQSPKDTDSQLKDDVMIDDDFGDFDDFQSANIISKATSIVEDSGNPWESAVSNESDFGNFTANFEEAKFHSVNLTPEDTAHSSNKLERLESETRDTPDEKLNDNDDFGDYDDFKSSVAKTQSDELTECLQSDELTVLNLHATENEHQILDGIANVLSSVFIEEIPEPEEKFEGKLESLLSETWGHLMETDERQPYIVNWNNSFGQKSLLKALCIDSRNILFGPKWSGNMPKYAANLSNAPLQPQKPTSAPSSILSQNETVPEKPSSKPTSWCDPFTSDGQESCNTENESSAITPVPTDLNVFEAAISTKPEKIFSNTIGVQPLRQINLPDTHIFTPTDSEIPRSKTIHYDLSPNIVLSQPALKNNKSQTDLWNSPTANNLPENNNDIENSEYWEFQNFKGTSDTSSLPGTSSSHTISEDKNCETATMVNVPAPTIAYQTELLQPIKIEPSIPALNWPDPGEVKEVFDDYSDFVSISSSSQPVQKPENSIPADFQLNIEKAKCTDVCTLDNRFTSEPATTIKTTDDGFEDDFDTFQSALPSKSIGDSNYLGNINQVPQSNLFNVSPKVDSCKSESISFTSVPRPSEALTQNLGHINKSELTINKSSTSLVSNIQGNILQPTSVNFSMLSIHNHQKSGQILQPLSLESYSQINWPSPGIDLQDLSRFNPVESVHSLKSDLSVNSTNKGASPVHTNQVSDDDVWGEFVSSKPKQTLPSHPKKRSTFVDDDEWTDFISSPTVKPQNGLNTISFNVHTNSNIHKSVQNKFVKKPNQPPIDIPTLNYITPKSNPHKSYNDKHFQNL